MLPLPVRKRSQSGQNKKKIPKRTNERNKEKSHGGHKNKKIKKEKRKRERGQHYYPLNPHLCFKVALVLQFVESFHIIVA